MPQNADRVSPYPMSPKSASTRAFRRSSARVIGRALAATFAFVLASTPIAHASTLAPDESFGQAGSVTATPRSGGADVAAVALGPGSIFLGGHAGGQGPAIIRFTDSGVPAEGWGTDGVLTVPPVYGPVGGDDFVAGLVTRADGQLVGIHHIDRGTEVERPMACPVQYTPRGELDSAFKARCLSWDHVAGGVWSRHDSRLTLIGAGVDGRTVVAQLDRRGRPVKSFGHHGRVVLGPRWGTTWMRGDGDRLLLAGKQELALESVSLRSGRARRLGALAAQREPDHPILVAAIFRVARKTLLEAFDIAHTQIFTTRFNADGQVDRRYGRGGIAATRRLGAGWVQAGVARLGELLVVQVGPEQTSGQTCSKPLRVVAVGQSGRNDRQFGTGGIEPLPRTLGCGDSQVAGVQTDAQRRLVIAGMAQQPDGTNAFFVDRFALS